MKYFIDTEFIENGKTIDLISIGIVSERNDKYYAINRECDFSKADAWIRDNVLNGNVDVFKLRNRSYLRTKQAIKNEIVRFIGNDKNVEFWADCGAYDHVVLCQLFGKMIDSPDNFPYYTNDIQQLALMKKATSLPQQLGTVHNALDDAKYVKLCYNYLMSV